MNPQYFPLLLLNAPDEQKRNICLLTAYEILGEIAILERISPDYFDGQQMTYYGVIEGLNLAKHTWRLTLRESGDGGTDHDSMNRFVQDYVDRFVGSIFSAATFETHSFFGRDSDIKKLRQNLAGWATASLQPQPAA